MAHVISDECISCGACADTCPVNAIAPGDTKYMATAIPCTVPGPGKTARPAGATRVDKTDHKGPGAFRAGLFS